MPHFIDLFYFLVGLTLLGFFLECRDAWLKRRASGRPKYPIVPQVRYRSVARAHRAAARAPKPHYTQRRILTGIDVNRTGPSELPLVERVKAMRKDQEPPARPAR